jgi:elongation factor Ts
MAISAKDVKVLRDRTDAPMMECKSALEEAQGDMERATKILRERGISKMAKRADRETSEGVVTITVGSGNRPGTALMITCETDFTAKNESFRTMANEVTSAVAAMPGAELTIDQALTAKSGAGTVQSRLDDVKNSTRENMTLKQVVRFDGVCGSYCHFDGKSGGLVEVELSDPKKAGDPAITALLRDVCMHIVAIQPPPLAVDADGIDPKVIQEDKEILIKQAMDSGKPKEIAEKMVEGRMRKFFEERALNQQPFVKNPELSIAKYLAQGGKPLGTTITIRRFARLSIGG